jgi:hypothetical protein
MIDSEQYLVRGEHFSPACELRQGIEASRQGIEVNVLDMVVLVSILGVIERFRRLPLEGSPLTTSLAALPPTGFKSFISVASARLLAVF